MVRDYRMAIVTQVAKVEKTKKPEQPQEEEVKQNEITLVIEDAVIIKETIGG